jgi:ABC-2 type transport system permease protein
MRSMLAMIRREYLEHRGAFLYAPSVIVVLFAIAIAAALAFNKVRMPFNIDEASALRFFEFAFLGIGGLWLAYTMVALFFYYADAFAADRRNNSMLFWKSMPLSDFQVLMSKMLAGMTLLPGLIFCALIVTGLVLYGLTGLAVTVLPRLVVPGIAEIVMSSVELGAFALVYLALSLLWYAPFFAWVGALSTAVGRWSIPLAFLIPGLAVLTENLFVRGLSDVFFNLAFGTNGPRGGYILEFLQRRATFGFNESYFETAFSRGQAVDGWALTAQLVEQIDWTQMGIGLIAAVLLVFIASEYRRRFVTA